MTVRTRGLVLRAMPVGDNDRLLTILSGDLGVITVSARGASRSGSRMAAMAQPLMYGDFMLFRGTTRYSLNGGDILVSFFNLALEPSRYETAVQMLAYAEDAGMVPDASSEVLTLTLHMLNRLLPKEKTTLPPELVAAAFQLKLAQIGGLAPHVTGCVRCGTTAIDEIRFSQEAGGFLCEACMPEDSTAVHISPGVAKAMLYVMCAPVEALFRFDLEPIVAETFIRLVTDYMARRWESRRRPGPSLYGADSSRGAPPRSSPQPCDTAPNEQSIEMRQDPSYRHGQEM